MFQFFVAQKRVNDDRGSGERVNVHLKIKEWIYDGKYSLQRMECVLKRNYYDAVADDDYDDDVCAVDEDVEV